MAKKNNSVKHVWQTNPAIINAIISICEINGITCIWEIGTFQGESSKAFKEAGLKVITSDIEAHLKEADRIEGIEYLIGNSPDIAAKVAEFAKGEKTAVFIDGDHSYEGCSIDFKAAEIAGLNGLVFFHDAYHDDLLGVNQFINEQTKNPHYYTLILPTLDNTGLGILKRK